MIHSFPYRLEPVQELEEVFQKARPSFASLCMQNIQSHASFLNRTNFSDGCAFHMEEKLNCHNVRVPRSENPHETRNVSREREEAQFGVPFNFMKSLDHITLKNQMTMEKAICSF